MLQSVFSDLSDLYPSLIPLKSLTDIKIALKKKKRVIWPIEQRKLQQE